MSTLTDWHRRNWYPFIFGGLLRDILILGIRDNPRDVDIVVRNGTSEELESSLQQYIKRRNRFGGFQLQLSRWNIDVWALDRTWAFVGNNQMAATAENLPKTTFLNVEAIAISLGADGNVVDVFEHGFFEAVRTQTLDINLEENPYPALSAVRSLATALKLKYAISPRLARYILKTHNELGVESMVAAQESHYGWVRFGTDNVRALATYLKEELETHPTSPITLPGSRTEQLTFWD